VYKRQIDTNAPVFARKEIVIHAPVEKVWELQTDIENWNRWQPDITSAKLEGALEADTIFRWKAKGLNIVSTLHTVIPLKQIGWTGLSLGMFAIHNWMFEARGKTTLVVTEESLSGWLTRLMILLDPRFLEKSLETSLNNLKFVAENK
jgi:uncharacterized membrane protein